MRWALAVALLAVVSGTEYESLTIPGICSACKVVLRVDIVLRDRVVHVALEVARRLRGAHPERRLELGRIRRLLHELAVVVPE